MGKIAGKVSFVWILISYLMIAGGFTLAAIGLAILKVEGEWVGYGVFFLGAFAGGFFAARASEQDTIIEPAVAGALFIGSIVLALSMLPGARTLFALAGDSIVWAALKIAFVTAFGGVVGGVAGERSSSGPRSTAWIRWAGVAAFMAWGGLFVFMVVFGILMGWDDDGWMIPVFAMAAGSFASGFLSQWVAPIKRVSACGFGTPLALLMMMVLLVIDPPGNSGEVIGGLVILMAITWAIGAIGAKIAASMAGKTAFVDTPPVDPSNLPAARLQ